MKVRSRIYSSFTVESTPNYQEWKHQGVQTESTWRVITIRWWVFHAEYARRKDTEVQVQRNSKIKITETGNDLAGAETLICFTGFYFTKENWLTKYSKLRQGHTPVSHSLISRYLDLEDI